MNSVDPVKNLVFYETFKDLPKTYHDLYPDDPSWETKDFLRINNNICSSPFDRMIIFKNDCQIYFLIDQPGWKQKDNLKVKKIISEVVNSLAEDFNCSPTKFEINITVLDCRG